MPVGDLKKTRRGESGKRTCQGGLRQERRERERDDSVRQRRKTREERERSVGREGDLARDTSPEEDRESQSWVHLFHQFSEILAALQLHTHTQTQKSGVDTL